MRVAIYARVSTGGQTVENQLPKLHTWAQAAGHEVVGEFVDHAISGLKGRSKRPALDRMLKLVAQRKVDVVAATELTRLGRSVAHLAQLAEELRALGVGLFVHSMGLDTSTPAGQLLYGMLSLVAQFERDLLVERTHAGLDRARRQGKRLGRPPLSPWTERRVVDLLNGGATVAATARAAGCCRMTVDKVKRAMHAT